MADAGGAKDKKNNPDTLALDAPVESLPEIGPKRAALLANLGIATVLDLLFHFPRAYEDRTELQHIADVEEGEQATIEAEVVSARNIRLRGRMSMAVVKLRDGTGEMTATFFGRGFLAGTVFQPGVRALFTGVGGNYKGPALKNPDYEVLSGDAEDRLHVGRVVPIYRLTEKVTQRMLRRWVRIALDSVTGTIPDALPPKLRRKHKFPKVGEALETAHFPDSVEAGRAARTRFAYEELLAIQLAVLGERAARRESGSGYVHTINGPALKALGKALPFTLTEAQERVISEVLADMGSSRPMMRLLQGDVGCGKTVVALHAIAAAVDGGYQTALMAPTEILAEQHTLHLREMLRPLGLEVARLTGSTAAPARARKHIERGGAHVVVGTHALFQSKTAFRNLGLVIIDEQHRFGVLQRQALMDKGVQPDVLQMTATPIPRTLAITVYGGMDLSIIDTLPPGRRPVKTRRVPEKKTEDMYAYIAREAGEGRQTYIICPLVEESAKRAELTSVVSHFEQLSAGPLAGVRAALLHGRLDPDEKDAIMHRFKAGELDVLFSTTVIEVGIDVATAVNMVIEDAAQFGLTQLHQLRGRVGRGADQSHCFLLGKPKTKDGRRRLDAMCKHQSGFDIAEIDLDLRGPGEFYGVRQAGLSDLRVADLIRDARLLDQARRDAQALLDEDPHLEKSTHAGVYTAAERFQSTLRG